MKRRYILLIFIIIILLTFLFKFFNSKSDPELFAKNLLQKADVQINGNRPWDIKVNNKNLYSRVMQEGSLGLGESYMDGWWDCKALDKFFCRILNSELDEKIVLNWDHFF